MKKNKELPEDRWFRWDNMLNKGEHVLLLKEFDILFNKKKAILVGDLVRREQALEELGVISFNKEKFKKEEKGFYYGPGRRKS